MPTIDVSATATMSASPTIAAIKVNAVATMSAAPRRGIIPAAGPENLTSIYGVAKDIVTGLSIGAVDIVLDDPDATGLPAKVVASDPLGGFNALNIDDDATYDITAHLADLSRLWRLNSTSGTIASPRLLGGEAAVWNMDTADILSGGAETRDSSGNALHLSGADTGSADHVATDFGKGYTSAALFRSVHDAALTLTGDMAYLMRVRIPSGFGNTHLLGAFRSGAGSEAQADNQLYVFNVSSTGTMSYFHEFGAGSDVSVTLGTTALNGFVIIGFIRDTAAKLVYPIINGVVGAGLAYSDNPDGGTNGAFSFGSGDFIQITSNATLDWVRIYNRTLSQDEVTTLANNPYAVDYLFEEYAKTYPTSPLVVDGHAQDAQSSIALQNVIIVWDDPDAEIPLILAQTDAAGDFDVILDSLASYDVFAHTVGLGQTWRLESTTPGSPTIYHFRQVTTDEPANPLIIDGVALDIQDDSPLQGVVVEFFKSALSEARFAETNASGEFDITVEDMTDYDIVAYSPDLSRKWRKVSAVESLGVTTYRFKEIIDKRYLTRVLDAVRVLP